MLNNRPDLPELPVVLRDIPSKKRPRSRAGSRRCLLAALAWLLWTPACAGEVEVLHWWTSGGEARALKALQATLQAKGHTWKDFAVAGGGGDSAMAVLRSRVVSGNAPSAAQLKGPSIQAWAAEGSLANIDAVAQSQHWDDVLPRAVSDTVKFRGAYVAAPVNVHRVNWMWINTAALRRVGGRIPATWDEFFATADKLRAAGILPLAHGGQPWQNLELLETVVLGIGGADLYRRTLIDGDAGALASPAFRTALLTFKRLRDYTDRNPPGRDWNLATGRVVRGEAAMQLMGDWVKGEFLALGKKPGADFLCAPSPGSAKAFGYVVDAFAMFKVSEPDRQAAQQDLATAVMSPEFQTAFNQSKGSIPARSGLKLDGFDDCARTSAADFAAASRSGSLVPSVAHGMAVTPAIEEAVADIVTAYWTSDRQTPESVVGKLAALRR